MFELVDGPLNVPYFYEKYFNFYKDKNFGAFLSFCGIVRAEDNIQALSFDIYDKLLKTWFDEWQKSVKKDNIKLCFAHSRGDVKIHESSYFAAVLSPQRKKGLQILNDFVEDFKARAPIWKYNIKNSQRIYAKDRSTVLKEAGLLQ